MIDAEYSEDLRKSIKRNIEAGLAAAFEERYPPADTQLEIHDVYAPFEQTAVSPATETKSEKRFIDAIRDGLLQSMERHENLVLMGQDIAEYGGVFKITEGFVDRFGKDRCQEYANL